MDNNIFAVDIGGSKLICGILTPQGEILDTYRAEYEQGHTLETVLGLIREGFERLKDYKCSYCGVAIPGLCNADDGTWIYSPFSGISDVPIVQILADMTGLPVCGDNDVNISALAERYYGVCKDSNDFLWITVSNGIGGGLFLDGKLYRGQHMTAGEIGHFIVEEDNGRRCGCGNIGCLEAMASGASIAAIYTERTGQAVSISAKEIADMARDGDETALRVWQEAGAYIGKAAAYVVNILDIDTVVLGGGAAQSFDLLEWSANKALERYVFAKAHPNVGVVHSSLGGYAALKGCAALVVDKYFNSDKN